MTLTASELYMQSYKQHLHYETSISKVDNSAQLNNSVNEKPDSDAPTSNVLNLPIIYASEDDMSSIDMVKKNLMQSILGAFSQEGSSKDLFPNDAIQVSKEHYVKENPYQETMSSSPFGFVYESSQEYYEKTSFEFNAQATIKTPNGEYQIEINFSYTQEFYEKHETQIQYAHSNFEKPFEINLDKDDDSLKNLSKLELIFDILREDNEEINLLDNLKEYLSQRHHLLLDSLENEKSPHEENFLDNFRVFEQHENSEQSLLVAQQEGLGVYLSNSYSRASTYSTSINSNGISLQSSSSYTESSSTAVFAHIKV